MDVWGLSDCLGELTAHGFCRLLFSYVPFDLRFGDFLSRGCSCRFWLRFPREIVILRDGSGRIDGLDFGVDGGAITRRIGEARTEHGGLFCHVADSVD